MTIGFRNLVLGDESTTPVSVTKLLNDDQQLQNYVTAIRTELARVEAQKKMLSELLEEQMAKCQHLVFRDVDAGMYAFRKCVICGFDMGSV
jgi:hypothetical protein